MKTKIVFVEKQFYGFESIGKVFRQIAKNLPKEKFETEFQQVPFGNRALEVFKNLFFFRRVKAGIYHVTGHIHYITLVLPRENTILTIHDLGFLHTRKGLRRFVLKKILLDYPIKKIKYITAVSEATKKEIIFYTKCREEKIRVIENPLQDFFYPEKKIFNEQCPRILQIGTAPNKNLINLIKALEGINCRLIIVGKLDPVLIKSLETSRIKYENKVELADDELRNEYRKADIVAACSTFEGFGLPLIEAQSMQTPLITSDISPLKEVSGGAAFLADPYNPLSIKKGILKIIRDKSFREDIVERGNENIKRFDSKYIAQKYQDIYQELLDQISHAATHK